MSPYAVCAYCRWPRARAKVVALAATLGLAESSENVVANVTLVN